MSEGSMEADTIEQEGFANASYLRRDTLSPSKGPTLNGPINKENHSLIAAPKVSLPSMVLIFLMMDRYLNAC